MGSEMCIRDSLAVGGRALDIKTGGSCGTSGLVAAVQGGRGLDTACLLYTSDAADERSSVDLGGRRIIKKKKDEHVAESRLMIQHHLRQRIIM